MMLQYNNKQWEGSESFMIDFKPAYEDVSSAACRKPYFWFGFYYGGVASAVGPSSLSQAHWRAGPAVNPIQESTPC